MSTLRGSVEDYLTLRRSVGYALRQEGRMLTSFVDHLEARGLAQVTVQAALGWARQPEQASPAWWARRLAVVRGFAAYLKTIDEATEVPPAGLLPRRSSRPTPYLYSPAEIAALMAAASRLASPPRAATFETLIGLMAVTGLRTGEAMNLDRPDVDLAEGVLTVRCSKLGKSRLVQLHATTTAALARYAARRDQLRPRATTPSFFLSGAGTRLNHTNASTTFAGLIDDAGITTPSGQRRPRLTDLRHSFAVATLITWHTDGADVQSRLPVLSTYLGHVKPSTTYWYLEAAPELLAVAAARLERFLGALP
jgi:integrase/recombinase XerD